MAIPFSLCNSLSSLSLTKPLPTCSPSPQLTLPLSSDSTSFSFLSASPPPPPVTAFSQSLKGKNAVIPVIPNDPDDRNGVPHDLMSVMCPSLAFANAVFYKSTYNVQVMVGEHESEEELVNRFRREVLRAGILQETKRRRFFENTREKRKRKSQEAARRNRKRRYIPNLPNPAEDELETSQKKKNTYREEDDHWDFVDVELPYC